MAAQDLTKNERKALRKQEKQAQKDNSAKAKMLKSIVTWVLVGLAIVLAVWGMLKLAATPVDNTPLAGEITEDDWVKGNPQAKAVIVEYSDFQCPACGSYYPMVNQIVSEFGEQIAFVYRHFPLSQHKNAQPAAYAAEAAGKQGKFWEMYDLIFQNQNSWSDLGDTTETFKSYAQQLNLDLDQYNKDANSAEVKNKVAAHYTGGVQSNVTYTPTFYLNGQKISNPRSLEDFRALIQAALDDTK